MYFQHSLMVAGLVSLIFAGCQGDNNDSNNPFLKKFDKSGKEDTAYYNPDGVEVEVDLEAEIDGPPDQLVYAPPELAQYALTYLRNSGKFYLESLAEDATSPERVEWLVDGRWLPVREVVKMNNVPLKQFRLRGVNAVLLEKARAGVKEGKVFTAKVPRNPFTTMEQYGASCAEEDDHLGLDQSIYWYLWAPEKSGCRAPAEELQEMKVTVSKVMPKVKKVYPEYDKLTADGKITVVMMFGQIGDGELQESDNGLYWYQWAIDNLLKAGFQEVKPAPVGRRYSKLIEAVTMEIDLYSPREFAGLDDLANFANFQRAIAEHEIVAYSGHSMLGASDFWSKPEYPSSYQIFLYGGCLGYQYYVRPILGAKKGWENLDLVSSVVEVPTLHNHWTSLVVAQIAYAVENGYRVSWHDIIGEVRESLGESTFGASGVRDNVFQP